jgi:hypothetical protein
MYQVIAIFNQKCIILFSVQKGLQFAINQIKEFCEENPNNNFKSTIYLLSNLDSTPAATLTESLAHKVAKELTKDDIQLIVG